MALRKQLPAWLTADLHPAVLTGREHLEHGEDTFLSPCTVLRTQKEESGLWIMVWPGVRRVTQYTGSSGFISIALTLHKRIGISAHGPTLSGSDLAGLALNILDMSSEFRCWATSHSLAVMSIRRQMSMSTFLAFSWILVSRSDICCREREKSSFRWCKRTEQIYVSGSQIVRRSLW